MKEPLLFYRLKTRDGIVSDLRPAIELSPDINLALRPKINGAFIFSEALPDSPGHLARKYRLRNQAHALIFEYEEE